MFVGAESFFSFDVFQGFVGKSGDKGVGGTVVSCTRLRVFLMHLHFLVKVSFDCF